MSFKNAKGNELLFSKTSRNDRFKQMTKQQQLIEEKKRQIMEKMEEQKKQETEDLSKQAKPVPDNKPAKRGLGLASSRWKSTFQKPVSKDSPAQKLSNVFSSDCSFLDQFKKISPDQTGDNSSMKDDSLDDEVGRSKEKNEDKSQRDNNGDRSRRRDDWRSSRKPDRRESKRSERWSDRKEPRYRPTSLIDPDMMDTSDSLVLSSTLQINPYSIPPPAPIVPQTIPPPRPLAPQNIPPPSPIIPQTIPPPSPLTPQNIPPPASAGPPPMSQASLLSLGVNFSVPPPLPVNCQKSSFPLKVNLSQPPPPLPSKPLLAQSPSPLCDTSIPPPALSKCNQFTSQPLFSQVPADKIQGEPDKFPFSVKQESSSPEDSKEWFQKDNLSEVFEDGFEIKKEGDVKPDRGGKRKTRWGETAPSAGQGPLIVPVLKTPVPAKPQPQMISKVSRTDPGLLQYAQTAYGTIQLSEEDWKKAEDNYKIHLLYQEMLRKRAEVERLRARGKNKYEYDSDEEVEGGTWEHKAREKEMVATRVWADSLTEAAKGKHHIGDFLPPEELKKFLEKYNAVKGGQIPDLSDYKEYKLKEDNKGFQMLQKLGWTEGQGLGTDGTGIVDPINKERNRESNQGLGLVRPDDVASSDDEYDAYRKRMMLAYRFRPNPLNNPRRPYY